MENLKLKICGLTKLPQIQELCGEVDFLGFIFYEKSPRYVLNSLTLNEVKAIQHPGKVGVFVNEELENIVATEQKADLNYIQLHGDENAAFISDLREELSPETRIIKALRIGTESTADLQKKLDDLFSPVDYFLFDTDSKSFGGTGMTFDWEVLKGLDIRKPYFLSGGISPESLERLQDLYKINMRENETLPKLKLPLALDINSRFEFEPGDKDTEKIKSFKRAISALSQLC
ncbi:phosphoribosylanthranilate isomerase [Kaistella palustris]|uniref:phosphoribosylanthranilate isomerase n=1 Tax=Kaistella palustris TaxID=493376 RepID=UPI00041AC9EB|nr:phosphoribosylanthranilate isomerase [Kaistella palustris]